MYGIAAIGDATTATPPRLALLAVEQCLQARGFVRHGVLGTRVYGAHEAFEDHRSFLWASADATVVAEAGRLWGHDILDVVTLFADGTILRTDWCGRLGGFPAAWWHADPAGPAPERPWDRFERDWGDRGWDQPASGVHMRRPSGGDPDVVLARHLAAVEAMRVEHGEPRPLDPVDVGGVWRRCVHARQHGETVELRVFTAVMLPAVVGCIAVASAIEQWAADPEAWLGLVMGVFIGGTLAPVAVWSRGLSLPLALAAWVVAFAGWWVTMAPAGVGLSLVVGAALVVVAFPPLVAVARRAVPGPVGLARMPADALLQTYARPPVPEPEVSPALEAALIARGFAREDEAVVRRSVSATDPTSVFAVAGVWRCGDTHVQVRGDFVSVRTLMRSGITRETRSLPDPGLMYEALGRDWEVVGTPPPVVHDMGRPWPFRHRLLLGSRPRHGLIVSHVRGAVEALDAHAADVEGEPTRAIPYWDLQARIDAARPRLHDDGVRLVFAAFPLAAGYIATTLSEPDLRLFELAVAHVAVGAACMEDLPRVVRWAFVVLAVVAWASGVRAGAEVALAYAASHAAVFALLTRWQLRE
jgi:hypothetical protein